MTDQPSDAIRYLGFDVNGHDVEVFLGTSFETFVLSKDEVRFRGGDVERVARRGDWIVRTAAGCDVAVSFPGQLAQWALIEVAHVVPENDTAEHALSTTCWCGPRVDPREPTGWLVVHAARDGRESGDKHRMPDVANA